MKLNATTRRPGLILLVVLGMLALFSLLAITYVLFSGHSRSASVALARSEIRGNKSARPLYDEAIMQLIRGTRDPRSSLYGHDLLGDVYGYLETLQQPTVSVRNYRYLPNGAAAPMSYVASSQDSWQRPVILGGHFLRIPLDPGGSYVLPALLPPENDALTGAIVTFPPGEGPLGGNSFRVVRYIGQQEGPFDTSDALIRLAQSYSITIDLADTDLSQTYAQIDPLSLRSTSMTLGEWAAMLANGANGVATTEGVHLCYRSVQADVLSQGYRLFFNATPLNSHGYGVFNDGTSQIHNVAGTPTLSMPVGLQTRIQDFAGLQSRGEGTLMGGPIIRGDSDEPYDAADFNNMFLSHRRAGATRSEEIIPSFHRAALINYIVNWRNPLDYTEAEFLDTLRRIQLVMGRPLSINIRTPSGPPDSYYLQRLNPAGSSFSHPSFTGSNNGAVTQLSFTIDNNWSTDWPSIGYPQFVQWLNFLTTGPWDVDNDGDGVMDSLWVDIGMPLQTSADGKLLKALVAYYVEDLDSKLDINATGNIAQANYGDVPYSQVTTIHSSTGPGQHMPQGVGYGPAEISFRHLFAKANLNWSGFIPETAYRATMISRYRRNPTENTEISPGGSGDDPLSILRMREHPLILDPANGWRRAQFSHGALPGLPVSVTGRTAHTLDRLGNIILSTPDVLQQGLIHYESPYESNLVTARHHDSPFTLAEWERIYRVADSDSRALPNRLQERFGESEQTLASSTLRQEITPVSRHLRAPKLTMRSQTPLDDQRPTSFYGLVNSIRQLKNEPIIPYRQFTQLFPLEFSRGLPLNLNRPFGNGVDDYDPTMRREDSSVLGLGEIDDPWELANITQRSLYVNNAKEVVGNVDEDYLGSVALGNRWEVPGALPVPPEYRGNETRQLFARHLYCLAQLIVPENYVFPNMDRDYYRDHLTDPSDRQAIRARTLAQWAVNIVDFRDSDATMTRFPYDSNPFDNNFEWNPDSVVWGLEQPELLLTESLAFHDLRVRNRSTDPNVLELEQYRIPQGSLFLELYCPRTTTVVSSNQNQGVPTSLYSNAGADVVLDLSRLTPPITNDEDDPDFHRRYPVWRVYMTGPVSRRPNEPLLKTPDERLRADPMDPAVTDDDDRVWRNDLTYQLPKSNMRPADNLNNIIGTSGLRFDHTVSDQALTDVDMNTDDARVVVFANLLDEQKLFTPGVQASGQVYDNPDNPPATPLQLHGNQYLVVGPRRTTYLGSRVEATADPNNLLNRPNFHRIELDTSTGDNWVDIFKATDETFDPTDATDGTRRTTMRPYVTMIAEAEAEWTDVGINVSERPAQAYYLEPDISANALNTQPDPLTGALGFADLPNDSYASSPAPFDNGSTGVFRFWDFPANPAQGSTGNGEVELVPENSTDGVVRPGTMLDWSTAYLQRLADPNKPWDATFNPYITVDWIPIDLTVFSGEENHQDLRVMTNTNAGGRMALGSRQKAGQPADATTLVFDASADGIRGQTFYSALTAPPAFSQPRVPPVPDPHPPILQFEIPIDEGRAISFRPTPVDGGAPGSRMSFSTLGFLNSTFNLAAESNPLINGFFAIPPEYLGAPGHPGRPEDPPNPVTTPGHARREGNWRPDSLFWTNREFINPLELAYVPLSSPGQLMHEFSATSVGTDFYGETTNAYPYAHLMNFFQAVPNLDRNAPLAMLMDLMETPSPWNDAYKLEPPATFAFTGVMPSDANYSILASQDALFGTLRAPYNTVARNVEPGRVNLNTIPEASPSLPAGSNLDSGLHILKGLWSNTLHPDARVLLSDPISIETWRLLQLSRRGFTPANGPYYNPPTASPIFNANYPTQFAGVFKPITEAGMVPTAPNRPSLVDAVSRLNPIQVTLMRGGPAGDPAQFLLPSVPLFSDNFQAGVPKHVFADLNRITRLGNLTTDRSNAFAVYLTIGLFEYDPDTQSIGMEYGADSGTTDRAKAFYVIDRSVPVGYRVGEDQNVDKTILLRRNLKN